MLDLMIIHPGAAHGIYGKLGDSLVAVEPPLWPRLIAGYIRDHRHSVQILDAEALKLSPTEVAVEVYQERPRLVAIAVFGHQPSASTQQMDGACTTARRIREIYPDVKIIMLGGHVSALPERTLREEIAIDFVCKGEGPVTIDNLLRKTDEAAIPGLGWRHHVGGGETQVVINPEAPLLDVKELHGNAWDLLPMHLYRAHNWQCFGDLDKRMPYAAIYTSLGCPYKCSFCCINAPFNSNRYRMRDPEEVAEEVKFLKKTYGVRTFKIIDEMFVLNENHYTDICKRLEPLNASDDMNFWAYARVDTVKSGHLAQMRRAGIKWLALGIESGSKYVRDGSNKRLKDNDIEKVVRSIQAADINVIGNYIFGLPDDDLGSMADTLALAMELNTEFANFYSAMAYPGSPLYKEALEKGWALPETWRGYSQHNDDCRPLDTQHIHGSTVLQWRDNAFNTYFERKEYQDMILSKFGHETLHHIRDMTKYQLKRKLVDREIA